MMNFLDELLEDKLLKVISLVGLFAAYLLDAFDNRFYYYSAAGITFFLLVSAAVRVYKQRELFQTEVLDIPIVVAFEPNVTPKYMLETLFKDLEAKSTIINLKEKLKKYRNIVEEELVFEYKGDLYDKERLLSFFQIIHFSITKMKENNPNKIHFHLLSYKRPSYGFWLGYIFENEELSVYQQVPDKDTINKIAHLKDRIYKNSIQKYEKFDIQLLKMDENSDTVLLAIKASSHKITFASESLVHYTNIVSMVAKHDGTIQDDEDWVLYAREIFTQLMKLQEHYKKIVIVHNMPESLAIIVGKATGNFWPVLIRQYDVPSGEYKEIMQLNDLRCYF